MSGERLIQPEYVEGGELVAECTGCPVIHVRTPYGRLYHTWARLRPDASPRDQFKMKECSNTHDIERGQVRWARGRCQSCGKILSDPESLARGLGPDCYQRTPSQVEVPSLAMPQAPEG